MSDIASKVRKRRQELGLSQTALAKKSGMSQQAIAKIEQGGTSRPRMILSLARALQVTPTYLSEDAASIEMGHDTQEDASPQPAIIEIDARASAGDGAINDHDEAVADWRFPAPILSQELRAHPENLRICKVVGDSMEPLLHPNDRILVDVTQRTPSPPGLFVIWDGDGLVTKRIEKIMGDADSPRLAITSANPAYRAYERTAEEVNIVGRVVGLIRWM